MRLRKKLEKYFVYFFTGVSIMLVVMGVSRVKGVNALGADSTNDKHGAEAEQNNQEASVIGAFSKGAGTSVLGASETISAEGKLFNTPWGDVGTSIKVKDGKIISVDISTLPDSPPSIQAKNILIQEALSAGSANIQSVTGATITSKAFIASLENALSVISSKKGQTSQVGNKSSVSPASTAKTSVISKVVATLAPTATKKTTATTSTTTTDTSTSGVSGTFTGNAYSTPWGNAVASITLVNGKITAVTMPQVPDSPPSVYAQPYLIEQALSAGGANIQGVSGATVVSDAFKASLESALAKSKGQTTTAEATTPAAPKPKVPLSPAQLAAQAMPSGLSGSFIGTSYPTPWGYASAEITLKNGKITGVSMPQVPNSSPSLYAQPFLVAQALAAGNSNIQGVTGATVVTDAFILSLESAIATARSLGNTSIPAAPAHTPAPAVSQTPAPTTTTPPPASAPTTVNGTFAGTPFSTKWGNAAVSVTFTNGVITGVTMPQIPNSPPSVQAAPTLIQRALAAGSANIQGVSGATVVSNAFKASLESAIVAASATGTVSAPAPTTTTTTTTTSSRKKHHDDDDD